MSEPTTPRSTRSPRPAHGHLRGRARRGQPRPAAVLRRPRHERHAEVDPGRVRGRGRHAHGQPRPARRGLRGRQGQGAASSARSTATSSTRARSSRSDYVAPGDQGQRPLRRRLPALHRARAAADRQARRRATRARPAATRSRTAAPARATTRCASRRRSRRSAPELKVIAPVRGWQMGREEEIAYAREHGIPVKGGTEVAALLDRRQPLGPLLGGRAGSRTSTHAPRRRRLPARDPARARRPTSPRRDARLRARASRSRSTASSSGSWSCSSASPSSAASHGVGIVDHIEDRIVGLKVRDIYEVPAAAIVLTAHQELENLVGTIHQNQFKPGLDRQWALPRLRRAVVGAAAHRPRRVHGRGQRAGHRHDRHQALQGLGARRHARVAQRRLRRRRSRRSPSPAACSPRPPRPGFIELWSLQSRMAHQLRSRS